MGDKKRKKYEKACEECPSYLLREMPQDVYDLIIDKQAAEKKKRVSGKNIERIIYQIIREWLQLTTEEPIATLKKDGNFRVSRKLDSYERSHLINAINIKCI